MVLLSSQFMNCMFTLVFTKLLQLQFWRALCHTNTCAVVSMATLFTLEPDILSFALLLSSHKIHPAMLGHSLEKLPTLQIASNFTLSRCERLCLRSS
jgi:hypothetical protein